MGVVAAIGSLAIAGVNSVKQADAQGAAQKQLSQQQQEEQDLINQAKASDAEQAKTPGKIQTRQFQEMQEMRTMDTGNGTIFTGPLGIPNAPGGGTKTLLGS